ncbi:segregation and condensation protein A [Paenibacillus pasadenensis]|uniref:Segregation and condensation protein A n=1 Tax=Paenibacillus pasadenensis TaxID=217090 RepID=A0A2N5N5M9_9BACL|nr:MULTISPECIES: segregation/condensation protein A [Paenibacillus]PLT45599.1 Segregation and condensation protein A [Paenibacillus pasadenensis]QGG56052.1 segregation/condensation protein A [Paenibacillus sp. B01]
MSLLYKLEAFEGPLDLLLHLLDREEIDIYDIPISRIADQYMDYLHAMQEFELDVTSEFLVMAATLLAIKSGQLLPRPPVMDEYEDAWDDEGMLDPRDELVQKLVEYRRYKQIAEHLRDREMARSLVYSKEPEDLTTYMKEDDTHPLEGLDLGDIMAAFRRALRKAARRTHVARIHRDEISVKDRIRDISELLREHETALFSRLVGEAVERHEIVVTFLAILELMKMKQVRVFQNSLFDDIVIHWRGEASDRDGSAAEIDY